MTKTEAEWRGAARAELRIEGVDLFYGINHVLKDVDLAIVAGELFAFLGPSGCGKTTLLRLIAGFVSAQRGRILVDGVDIAPLPPWRRDVGMVFQSYALWPHMTVRDNVAFGLEERRLAAAEIRRRVDAVLQLLGLAALADRRPSQLSGGQQQRVALARTIVVEPKLLLLDEPLSNLDAKLRVQVRRELRDMQRRLGLTTVFVTHDQEEANTISDRIAVMSEGVVQQVGTPVELYERPANLFVAGFLGAANFVDGRVSGTGPDRRFVVGDAVAVPIPAEAAVPAGARMMFRPQNAKLRPKASGTPAAAACLPGVVRQREFLGATLRYSVATLGSAIDIDMPFQSGGTAIEPGTEVDVELRPSSLLWLAA
jgi:iron(III) transport system ATP-binding protein